MINCNNYLTLGRHVFPVKKSLLIAIPMRSELFWQLRIWSMGDIRGSKVNPYAYSENLIPFYNRSFKRWQDALSEEITWNECYDEDLETRNAGLSLGAHDDIDKGVIRFSNAIGLDFRIHWSGIYQTSSD